MHCKVPAVATHRVERLPESVRAAHHELLASHLDGLAAVTASPVPGGSQTTSERLAAIGRNPATTIRESSLSR